MSDKNTFDPALVSWVFTDADVAALCEAIVRAEEVVLDLETTGLNEHATGKDPSWPAAARIVLASFTLPESALDEPTTWVVPLSHPESPFRNRWQAVITEIARVIKRHEKPLVNQNLKFDLRWVFAHTGIDLSRQTSWDTQISSHLLDENESTKLKEVAPRTFGIDRWDDFDLSTPAAAEKVPLIDLGLYAARDTYWTWRLACTHRYLMNVHPFDDYMDNPGPDEIENAKLGRFSLWCAMPMVATLTAMEQRGVLLDQEWVHQRLDEQGQIERDLTKVLTDLYEIEGEPSFAPTSNWFRAWTEAAVEAGDLRIASLTPNGKPQWSKSVLMRQARNGSEIAENLLTLRGALKEQEFLRSWLSYASPASTVHATYHAGRNYDTGTSGGTVTGRTSSSNPNLQQVSKELRAAFIPRPGYYVAELDYSQIELRIAAFVSRCVPMIEAFWAGKDLHILMASTTTGKPEDLVTKAERQRGKAGNFGYVFGMSASGFREYAETNYGVILTDYEAEQSRQAFFDQWEGMAQWHLKVMAKARRDGQVVSPLGRVRRLPNIWDTNEYLLSQAERQAINSPVQSFASDLMQLASASIEGTLPGFDAIPDVHLVGTVHDSIVVEVPIDDWQRATARCMRRMLGMDSVLLKLGCDFDVPLAAEGSIGTRWGYKDIGVIA